LCRRAIVAREAAARYNINDSTVLRAHSAPEQAILQEIRSSKADLVVLGVDRIRGEKLDFGSVAHAVLVNPTRQSFSSPPRSCLLGQHRSRSYARAAMDADRVNARDIRLALERARADEVIE
jgi:hypothetical protein